MSKIDKEYKVALDNAKNFSALSQCRHLDFPSNRKEIALKNLQTYLDYYKKIISAELGWRGYHPRGDYVLVTNILNCLSSVKSYLNRKKREIDNKDIIGTYKTGLQNIYAKYWKSKRNETCIDKLIILRDIFEHDKISGISIKALHNADRVEKFVMINDVDFNKLLIGAYAEIEKLDEEIKQYVEEQLSKLNLRHNILLLNAFHRFFKKKHYSLLFPEETVEEKEHYDNYILSLKGN